MIDVADHGRVEHWLTVATRQRDRADKAEAENARLRALLIEAREREARYVPLLYRDPSYPVRIDAALRGEET